MPLDPSKVFYCLNSSNDLAKTEGRFANEFKKLQKVGWRGSIGKAPTEMELVSALQSKDLVMYAPDIGFGHKATLTNYLAMSAMEALSSISGVAKFEVSASVQRQCYGVVLLVPCEIWVTLIGRARPITIWSPAGGSYPGAALDPMVDIAYSLSPTLVATLWDVTDRDIDTFAQSTFEKLRLNLDDVKARKAGRSDHTPVSVVTAVATSREVCKLKYLNGAAPVVYGIPFYL